MAYEKIGFSSGDVLKAEDLNHMEEGIENLGIIILMSSSITGYTEPALTFEDRTIITRAEFLNLLLLGKKFLLKNSNGQCYSSFSEINSNGATFGSDLICFKEDLGPAEPM